MGPTTGNSIQNSQSEKMCPFHEPTRQTGVIMRKKCLFAAYAAVSCLSIAHASGEGWTSDYATAKKEAIESGKDLMLDFTGSDWCPPCRALTKNVFSKPEFRERTKEKLALVEVDFPNDKSKLSEEIKKQNETLKSRYAIESLPTVLLCDVSEKPYAMVNGYQGDSFEVYVARLESLRACKEARDKAFQAAASMEGEAKAKALLQGLGALKLPEAMIVNFYSDVMGQIRIADPELSDARLKKLEDVQKLNKYFVALNELGEKKDYAGAIASVDKVSSEFEGECKQQILAVKGGALIKMGKADEADKVFEEAIAVDPESDWGSKIEAIRQQYKASAADPSEADEK